MAIEIERKFLVTDTDFLAGAKYSYIAQGYLSTDAERTVRIRIKDRAAWITIKGITQGISREEYEYEIPLKDAEQLLTLCKSTPIYKRRYIIEDRNLIWEVDVFEQKNKGLVLAEVELENEDVPVITPSWIDLEVSGDERYYNSYLSQHPFTTWTEQ